MNDTVYRDNANNEKMWTTSIAPSTIQPWPTPILPGQPSSQLDSYIVIPPFTVEPIDAGIWQRTTKVFQFNYSSPKSLVLKAPRLIDLMPNPGGGDLADYIGVIRFRDSSGNTIRYKFWDLEHFGFTTFNSALFVVDYDGQVILPNFSIELWSYSNAGALANLANRRILTSPLFVPISMDDNQPKQLCPITSQCAFQDDVFNTNNFPIPIPINSATVFIGN